MAFHEELLDNFSKMMVYREAAGYATKSYVSSITPFLNYCGENHPNASAITREMVDNWLEKKRYSANSQASFISCIRQYTRFINFLGGNAFVPDDDYSVRRIPFFPYVFTDFELKTLFDSFDGCVGGTRNKNFHPELVVPPIFRVMYCCGMRPSEPLRLFCNDVNLESGDVYIRETKNNKDRHIIMSEDLRSLCSKYDEMAGDRTWFFEHEGKPYSIGWVDSQFRSCWNRSGLQAHGRPRPYDLRHAFATRNIMKWIDKNLDVMALLPFLSTYMGHAEIISTLYYVHILSERIRKSAGIDWKQFSVIYGKGVNSDED